MDENLTQFELKNQHFYLINKNGDLKKLKC